MNLIDIFNKMHSKEIYYPSGNELMNYQAKRIQIVNKFNKTKSTPKGMKVRTKLYQEMFKEVGDNCYIEPPFHANVGGAFMRIGNNFYANFNLTVVDDGVITIGNSVMIGPNVTLATACHPISPNLRKNALQYNLPITIQDNVWIGAGAVIMPGVVIGENSIIGAGSIVTKDIPANVIAVGNPCRILRKITKEDDEIYNHHQKISQEIKEKYL